MVENVHDGKLNDSDGNCISFSHWRPSLVAEGRQRLIRGATINIALLKAM